MEVLCHGVPNYTLGSYFKSPLKICALCVLMCVCRIRETLIMGNKNKNINSEKQIILISHCASSSGFSLDFTKKEMQHFYFLNKEDKVHVLFLSMQIYFLNSSHKIFFFFKPLF